MPKPEQVNQSDVTSLEQIEGDVKTRCGGNSEREFEAYKIHLDAIVTKRKAVIRDDLKADTNLDANVVNDSFALSALVDIKFKEISSSDVEVTGLVALMREARGVMVAQAAAKENQRMIELQSARLQDELSSLKSFRDDLDRLGLDTTQEVAEIALFNREIAELV